MGEGCRGNFVATSRAELIEHYAMDLWEEMTPKGFDELPDDHKALAYDALQFGVRVACTALGETGSYEQEYQRIVYELRAQQKA